MRSTLPLIISFVVGLLMVGEFFIPHWKYHLVTENLLEWGVILAAGAFFLGLINLLQVNLPKILERQPDWQYKVVMMIGLVGTLVAGFVGGGVQRWQLDAHINSTAHSKQLEWREKWDITKLPE